MIDCKITKNYLREKARMSGECEISCRNCPLWTEDREYTNCKSDYSEYSVEAIAIVQAWSDAHPVKTYLSDFLDKYPNAVLSKNGTPSNNCPRDFGLKNIGDCGDCTACWNQPMER